MFKKLPPDAPRPQQTQWALSAFDMEALEREIDTIGALSLEHQRRITARFVVSGTPAQAKILGRAQWKFPWERAVLKAAASYGNLALVQEMAPLSSQSCDVAFIRAAGSRAPNVPEVLCVLAPMVAQLQTPGVAKAVRALSGAVVAPGMHNALLGQLLHHRRVEKVLCYLGGLCDYTERQTYEDRLFNALAQLMKQESFRDRQAQLPCVPEHYREKMLECVPDWVARWDAVLLDSQAPSSSLRENKHRL